MAVWSVGKETRLPQMRDEKALLAAVNARQGQSKGEWAAYGACALAFLYAAVSFYWAAGGTAGLSTIGGSLEEMGRAHEPAVIALVWGVGFAKLFAAFLALALVRSWGQHVPRRLLLVVSWGVATLLSLYGAVLTCVGLLVVTGVIPASTTADWMALRWHAFLWDPWFLLWGVLLGVATWRYQRSAGIKSGVDVR